MALPLVSSKFAEQAESSAIDQSRAAAARVFALWHLASVDAPSVAVVWTLAMAWAAGVHLDPWIPAMIACGTWTVYVGDRLLDAHRAIGAGRLAHLRERHYFHWRHRRKLVPIAVCTAAVATALVVRLLPVSIREHDFIIAAAALAYFSGVHSRFRFPGWLRRVASKEFLVGVLFTAGCAAPSLSCQFWASTGVSRLWAALVCVIVLAILAWWNCRAIERWELSLDCSGIGMVAATISMIAILVSLTLWFAQPRPCALVCAVAVSALLLLILDRKRHRIAPLTLRALADLVLLTPALLLLFGARHG